jgi:hypothetical protein
MAQSMDFSLPFRETRGIAIGIGIANRNRDPAFVLILNTDNRWKCRAGTSVAKARFCSTRF